MTQNVLYIEGALEVAIHARIVLPRIHLCSLKDALEPTSTLLELVDQFVSAEPRQQLLQQSLGHGCILLPRVELLDHLEQLLLVLLQKECDHFGDAFGLLLAVIGGLEGLVSGQDCVLYLSGESPYGISGKTGGICRDKHPQKVYGIHEMGK